MTVADEERKSNTCDQEMKGGWKRRARKAGKHERKPRINRQQIKESSDVLHSLSASS